ncbi:MAG: serine hydrolase, partial [Acidobacteria bacterium]|nr:serine hydrolase [Acidobacteriota bacterium]
MIWPLMLAACLAAGTPFPPAPELDAVMEQAIREDRIPGGVILIGHQGRVVFQKAYGLRSRQPDEPMTLETIFDAASLTKVVVTASSVMKLFEQGKIRLNDPVTTYLPEFQGGQSPITIRNLLTHFSGLRPDLDMPPAWSGHDTGMRLVLNDKPVDPPGVRFVYSDLNFILLGEVVERVSGLSLAEFARRNIFAPLKMNDSMFNPPPPLRRGIAPTEQLPGAGAALRGVVHDPTARAMGGVAGHAGLFTTAADLSRFAEMMLNGGKANGVRLFTDLSVEKFTTPQSPAGQPILRGLGWDLDSPYSGNRGELFPIGSYGHTGFTGTSLWIDPVSRSYVILLTNSVYPHLRPAITSLRGKVATIAAGALGIQGPGIQLTGYNETLAGPGVPRVVNRNSATLNGIDVLLAAPAPFWQGKRIGLITNQTGLTRDGRRNVDALLAAGLQVTALFSPEHGWEGGADTENVDNTVDAATNLRVWSLYKQQDRQPTAAMLA